MNAKQVASKVVKKISGFYDKESIEQLRNRVKNWEDNVLNSRLDENGEIKPEYWTRHGQKEKTKPEFRSGSGEFVIKEVYTPLDIAHIDPVKDIGLPGEYPYARGKDPLGPQAVTWPMKFYSGYGSGKNVKDRYKALYDTGSRFITLALDLPTQLGYDSDNPWARGEVGKVGVALDTLADIEYLLDWMPLDEVITGTVGNCIGHWAFCMFYLLAEKQGVDMTRMKVNIQNDPIKEYIGRGTYIFPPSVAIDLAADMVAYVCERLPVHWETQYNCTTTLRWGGCNCTQEVGFGIANLLTYVEAAQRKGVRPEELIPRLNLHMTADNDFFEEVAKFRAVRRLWAKIALERLDTDDPRALSLRITIYTGANRSTAQQPLNNVVRSTVHTLASMVGGVETISVPAYDEALALPTLEATRLASLIPHVLNDECMVCNTADPLAGSYYVEWLTDKIEEGGRFWYEQVEAQGGAIAAMESGYYLQQMANGQYEYQKEVEEGKRQVIGVNKFVVEEEQQIETFEGDPEGERQQVERLEKVRQERDNALVEKTLARLKKTAEEKAGGKDSNIVPLMLDAVRAYASIGEIFGVLREVFGEYKLPVVF